MTHEAVLSLRRSGRLADTLPLLQAALRASPNDADLHNELGLTHVLLGDAPRGLASFEQAVALSPGHARAQLNRGKALEQLGRPGFAEAYQLAVAAAPDLAEAQARLASVLEAAGRRQEALAHYTSAAALVPPSGPAGRLYRTRMAMIAEDLAGVERGLRGVLADDPGCAPAQAMLGRVLSARGQFAAAAAAFEAALVADPADVALYYDLAKTRRVTAADDPLIARMRAALAAPAPAPARLRLLQGLAKALDDAGEYGEAAAALAEAGRLRATLRPLDRDALRALTDQLIAVFTPAYLVRPGHQRNPSDRPILVLGLPRSGTTLTETMLARHPAIAGAGELGFWDGAGPHILPSLLPGRDADLRGPAGDYLARLAKAGGARYVIDKNPFNYRWALLAHLALPNARIIHVRRNKADTALSIMLAALQPQRYFSSAPDDLLLCMREYERLMAHTRAVLPPDRFYELDYEDLVTAPEPRIRALLSFLGLAYDAACLAPEQDTRAVMTASTWQVRQAVHGGSVGRWRNYAGLLGAFIAESK